MILRFVLISFLSISSAWAAIDTFTFSEQGNRELFQELAEELRCPKCQNQNLSDSNSPIAADMRREIYRMVEEGQSGEQVTDFMVARYGDFVRYRPKNDESTWLLWYGPIGLISLGLIVVVFIASRRKTTVVDVAVTTQDTVTGVTETGKATKDKERLKKILANYEDKESS